MNSAHIAECVYGFDSGGELHTVVSAPECAIIEVKTMPLLSVQISHGSVLASHLWYKLATLTGLPEIFNPSSFRIPDPSNGSLPPPGKVVRPWGMSAWAPETRDGVGSDWWYLGLWNRGRYGST